MRTRFMLLCGFALAVASACAEEALVPNLDLSEGLKGWSAWTGATAHPWTLDPNGRGGKPALRIDAQDATHNVMVMTHTDALKPGQRYALEAWWRLGDMNPDHQVDLRVIFRDAKGKWLTGEDLHSHATKTEKDWVLKRYRLIPPERTASTAVGVWVRETTGTIWVSDMSIRLLPPGERSFDSMSDYDPHQVQLGMAPLKSFYKLKESGSPFLAAAKRWNQLLVDAAFWQEDVSRARRAALYSGREESALAAHAKALAQALADLDRLQQTYGRLYAAGRHADLAATFDPAADKLAAFVTASHAAVKGLIAEWRPAAEGPWLTIPKAATDQPWWDAAKGQPRYMLWNRWSDARFRDLEEPLQMGDCQTLTAGAPSAFQNGVASWQAYLDQRPPLDEAGARRFSLITHYSLHDKGYLAREFVQ
ncbi:MAG: hypothetical protein FJ278_20740, partial [Planctomycetes bacterium]|nr:hypothetical protein [Planctomycetota bacterium]